MTSTQNITYSKKPIWSKDIHILLVDDDDINLDMMTQLLTETGVSVSTATNGSEVIKKTETYEYDLIFMDIIMPELTGYEVTKILRHNGIKTPIVALTGMLKNDCYIESGMNDILIKPILQQKMYDILEKYLGPYNDVIINTKDNKNLKFIGNMHSIDIKQAQQYIDIYESEKTYIQQLHKIKNYYTHTFKTKLINHYKNGEFEACMIEIHNLKNLSGLIGATNIHTICKFLQIDFMDNNFNNITENTLMSLFSELELLIYELTLFLPKIETIHSYTSNEILNNLKDLIEENDYKILGYLEEHEEQLINDYGEKTINLLKEAVEKYNFESSLKIIENIMSNMTY